MNRSLLYKIVNKETTEEEVLFYKPFINSRRNEIYNKIINGDVVAYDILNSSIEDVDEAGTMFLNMIDLIENNPLTWIACNERNMRIAFIIISIVRYELKDHENGIDYLNKLSPAIDIIQVGMFNDASNYILSLIPDDIITDEQLNRWSNLLLSANSLVE